MSEKHKPDKDGLLKDGVSHYPADTHDMQSYEDARQALSQFQSPVLLRSNNRHDRLFVASFDGTNNDAVNNPEHTTNIASIHEQIKKLNETGEDRIKSGYVAGPGTQKNPITRIWDGARGHTYDERLEEMYEQFIVQAKKWLDEDPDARIRLADIGFSRGAEQAAGFARLVHERGIVDPASKIVRRDEQGNPVVEYTRFLVPPGQVAQVVGLLDPVGTGEPLEQHDRRLPPSVISGIQIIAEDERRSLFKSSHIIDPGLSPDGRFLGVVVGGAHSDIGGSYHRDGLSIRCGNFLTDYLNSTSDLPFVAKRIEPDDPRLNVVHRSEEGMLLYRITDKVDRLKPEGYSERLVPQARVGEVADPHNAEPRDEALNRQFERQPVRIGPTPTTPDHATPAHANPPPTARSAQAHVDRLLDQLAAAATRQDDAGMKVVAGDYLQSAPGQAWTQEVRDRSLQLTVQEQQAAQESQQLLAQHAQEVQTQKNPAMRP